uniref:Acyl-CoA thioesterase 17 n=1 Tax=Amphiprion percula TaxID=161767 RepID=A0A3P8TS62_AMPPE
MWSKCRWSTVMFSFLHRRSSVMSQTPPIVSVLPTRGLVDEKFKVLVENLPPGRPVTVRSLHHSDNGHYWEAFGFYTSDHRGTVNVSKDQSVGGTYTGKEPMGLLWSMCPVPGSHKGLRLRKLNMCSPMLVNISVHSGHEGFRDGAPLASVLVERWYMAPGVKRIDVQEKGLLYLFSPGPFPGILDLWGGGGGLVEYRSALLASHGFATMSLDYLSCGQPVFTYVETAFNFIKDHPQVIADRVGVVGLCLGSLPALYLAADSTVVKVVKQITSPLLLVSGCDDQNWPSFETAEDINQTMRAAGNDHLLSRLDYPDSGHLIEPPFSPHFRASTFVTTNKRKAMILWGGKTKPHSDAQEDSWRKILSFLQQHLCCSLNAKL